MLDFSLRVLLHCLCTLKYRKKTEEKLANQRSPGNDGYDILCTDLQFLAFSHVAVIAIILSAIALE